MLLIYLILLPDFLEVRQSVQHSISDPAENPPKPHVMEGSLPECSSPSTFCMSLGHLKQTPHQAKNTLFTTTENP
jgi:hypothetical protein